MTTKTIIGTLLVCFYVPLLCVITTALVWQWRTKRNTGRSPFTDKLLRAPGESLRIKIDELSERLGNIVAVAIGLPAFVMAGILLSSSESIPSLERVWAALATCLVLVVPGIWFCIHKAIELRNYRLGFAGERATGEELNQLMRDGCRVFHDIPMAPYGNIDHVIVSSAGVFAVETKARLKRAAPKGKRDCDANFDGEGVVFPTGRDLDMVNQARTQGKYLHAFLASAVGETVAVLPILTLPGWFVKSSARRDDILVLNPGQIGSVVTDTRKPMLSPQMMQRIAHQLEQKCRDVVM